MMRRKKWGGTGYSFIPPRPKPKPKPKEEEEIDLYLERIGYSDE